MIKIAIIEDSQDDAKVLETLFITWARVNKEHIIYRSFEKCEMFLRKIINGEDVNSYHTIFIDIQMGGISGLDLAIKLRKQFRFTNHIIITTNFKEYSYAKIAIDLHVLKYLEKPINMRQIDPLLTYIKRTANRLTFSYRYNRQEYHIEYKDIIYFTSVGRKTRITIHTNSTDYNYKSSIKKLCGIVPDYFIRCNRSYLVNGDYITNFHDHSIWLGKGDCIQISVRCMASVKEKLVNMIL